MSKYQALRAFLQSRSTEAVPMTFAEIERVLGFKLPPSQSYRAWWSNNPTNNVMTKEWLAAGYKTEQVDLEGRRLVFRRVRSVRPATSSVHSARKGRPPLFGWLKGTVTVAPDADLTAPADEEWAELTSAVSEGGGGNGHRQ